MTDKSLMTLTRMDNAMLVTELKTEVELAAGKIIHLAPGGRRYTMDEAIDLALYSVINQLNPFNGECYYLERVGPIAGVAGYRRKANEQLRTIDPTGRFWLEFREAQKGEADFDPDKDIAWVATLHDSVTKREWEQSTLRVYMELTKGGMEGDKAWAEARSFVGAEPTWTASAVVDHRENFSKEGKPDKWDRVERCKKRAEKWVLRKRFPEVHIKDPELGDVVDAEFVEAREEIRRELLAEQAAAPRSEAEIMGDLGYTSQDIPERQDEVRIPDVPGRPMNPETLKAWLDDTAQGKYSHAKLPKDSKQRKVLAACVNTIFAGDETKRYELFNWLAGAASTADISAPMVCAMTNDWLVVQDFGEPPAEMAIKEARSAHELALVRAGQQVMEL